MSNPIPLRKIAFVSVQGYCSMTTGDQFFYALLCTEGIDLNTSALRGSIRRSFLFNDGLENNEKITFRGVASGDFTPNTVFKFPIRKFRKVGKFNLIHKTLFFFVGFTII